MGRGRNQVVNQSSLVADQTVKDFRSDKKKIQPSDLREGDSPLVLGPEIADNNTPLLLLDIDGVLSPLNPPETDDYQLVEAGYQMHFNKQLPGELGFFIKHSTPVWATTWEETANENNGLRNHLGLPELAWLNFRSPLQYDLNSLPEDEDNQHLLESTKKLPAVSILADAYPDRPIIWCEDDISLDAIQWGQRRNQLVPTLICSPKRDIGLTEEHFSEIRKFLDQFN
jgi:hypothetical protein